MQKIRNGKRFTVTIPADKEKELKEYVKRLQESNEGEDLNRKLKSLLLYLEAHPDNEENSECADRIEELKELLKN